MFIRIRYEGQGAHIRARVFVGRTSGDCGLSGALTLRLEEWEEFKAQLETAGVDFRTIDELPFGPAEWPERWQWVGSDNGDKKE